MDRKMQYRMIPTSLDREYDPAALTCWFVESADGFCDDTGLNADRPSAPAVMSSATRDPVPKVTRSRPAINCRSSSKIFLTAGKTGFDV